MTLPPGVTANPGTILNPNQVRFVAALRSQVPSSIPLHITSGTRTAESQAAALVTKRRLGDNIVALYRQNADIARALLAVPNTVPAMATVLRRYMAAGRFLSRHMRGDALDLRSRNLTSQQVSAVVAGVRSLGAKPVVEGKPAHIHVEGLGGSASLALSRGAGVVRRGAMALAANRVPVYTALALVTVGLVGALAWQKKQGRSAAGRGAA